MAGENISGFHDTHHIYWPRREYRGHLEGRFRNLGCHKVRLPRALHSEIHALYEPPPKPSKEEMQFAIARHEAGDCVCGGGKRNVPDAGGVLSAVA